MGCVLIYMFTRNHVLLKDTGYMPIINNTLVGASGAGEKYATITFIMLMYLKLLFLPNPLTWDYGYNQIPLTHWDNILVIVSFIIYAGLVYFAIKGIKKKNIFSFCIIFYLITISISLNIFVLIAAVMAERFLFVPSIAFCIAVAYVLTKYLGQENSKKFTPGLVAACSVLLALYSYGSFSRNW